GQAKLGPAGPQKPVEEPKDAPPATALPGGEAEIFDRLMKNLRDVTHRLDEKDAGSETQQGQKEILDDIDRLLNPPPQDQPPPDQQPQDQSQQPDQSQQQNQQQQNQQQQNQQSQGQGQGSQGQPQQQQSGQSSGGGGQSSGQSRPMGGAGQQPMGG